MTERLVLAALFRAARLARYCFAHLARRSFAAEHLLLAAGVDVDRLVREGHA